MRKKGWGGADAFFCAGLAFFVLLFCVSCATAQGGEVSGAAEPVPAAPALPPEAPADAGLPVKIPPGGEEAPALAEPVPEPVPELSLAQPLRAGEEPAALPQPEPPRAEEPPREEAASGAEAGERLAKEEPPRAPSPAPVPPPVIPPAAPPAGKPPAAPPPEKPLPPAVSAPAPEKPAPVPPPQAGAQKGSPPQSPRPDPKLDFFPPGASASITAGPSRDASGSVGNPITVALPGTGWIFMPDESLAGKIRYLGKSVEDGETVFSFSAFEKGDYNLKFQQQDLAANTVRYDDVRLSVNPNTEAASGEAVKADAQSASGSAVSAAAAAQSSAGPLGAPAPGEGVLSAPSAPEGGREQNSVPVPEASAAPSSGDVSGASPAGALSAESPDARLERLLREGRLGDAGGEAEKYVEEAGPGLSNKDEWYFALAQLFEKDEKLKDMKKALSYYEKVRDGFPLSRRWPESDTRSRYIRFNFFDIR